MSKIGLVLNNIGSPELPTPEAVDIYLKKFLMDKDVINLPFILRWILVHWIIVPKRKFLSAANYKKVWTDQGSPLIAKSRVFAEHLQKVLGENYEVILGMRYSEPSLESAFLHLQKLGITKIILAPMYPQFAEATTGSTNKEWSKIILKHNFQGEWLSLKPFYNHPLFISSQAKIIKKSSDSNSKVLLSYHGLPESQILKKSGCQLNQECCLSPVQAENGCYKAQCLQTTKKIAEALPDREFTTSFQSRLGRARWIGPSTQDTLVQFGSAHSSLNVACPSFVTDCLETLEEIALEGQKSFKSSGGQDFKMISCLNEDEKWIRSFAEIVQEESCGF